MRIGVIQASSRSDKNKLLYDAVCKYAPADEVINFGCDDRDTVEYSYVEIAIMIGMLLGSKTVDFVVTGCSSGQGMMLACNSMPGVVCGYAPTPKDAYLFVQINNGNAISVPLGEEYTWAGKENLEKTIAAIFKEPFGQGYPAKDSERKIRDAAFYKELRESSQIGITKLLNTLSFEEIEYLFTKKNVIDRIMEDRPYESISMWISQHYEATPVSELLDNINRLHTSELGEERIRKNLKLPKCDVVDVCKQIVRHPEAHIERIGKNWYVTYDDCVITINAFSLSIITAKLIK